MPRRSRIDLPGTVHHITIRGVDRMQIFRDDEDAADLLARFERWAHETRSQCLAWSFNGNHAHWVIVRRERSMAELMARFTSAYAQRFNRRYERVGPLFQGRYKSRVIRGEEDLRWMAFYALANPVRHGITGPAGIDDYLLGGWGAVFGKRTPHSFESVEAILRLFGETDAEARRNLRDGLDIAVETKWRAPWEVRLERIVDEACRRNGIPREEFSSSSSCARAAHADAARRAIRDLGLPWRLVEAQLGIPQSRIARALRDAVPRESRADNGG
jgi:REP element-mobilizing transposase RayT